jgi:hypothetical protein
VFHPVEKLRGALERGDPALPQTNPVIAESLKATLDNLAATATGLDPARLASIASEGAASAVPKAKSRLVEVVESLPDGFIVTDLEADAADEDAVWRRWVGHGPHGAGPRALKPALHRGLRVLHLVPCGILLSAQARPRRLHGPDDCAPDAVLCLQPLRRPLEPRGPL